MNTRYIIHARNPACKVRMAMSKTDWRSAADISKESGEYNAQRTSKIIRMYADEFGGVEKKTYNNVVLYRLIGNMVLDKYEQSIIDLLRTTRKEWTPKDICIELNLPYDYQRVGNMLIVLMTDYPIQRKKVKMYHTYTWME